MVFFVSDNNFIGALRTSLKRICKFIIASIPGSKAGGLSSSCSGFLGVSEKRWIFLVVYLKTKTVLLARAAPGHLTYYSASAARGGASTRWIVQSLRPPLGLPLSAFSCAPCLCLRMSAYHDERADGCECPPVRASLLCVHKKVAAAMGR